MKSTKIFAIIAAMMMLSIASVCIIETAQGDSTPNLDTVEFVHEKDYDNKAAVDKINNAQTGGGTASCGYETLNGQDYLRLTLTNVELDISGTALKFVNKNNTNNTGVHIVIVGDCKIKANGTGGCSSIFVNSTTGTPLLITGDGKLELVANTSSSIQVHTYGIQNESNDTVLGDGNSALTVRIHNENLGSGADSTFYGISTKGLTIDKTDIGISSPLEGKSCACMYVGIDLTVKGQSVVSLNTPKSYGIYSGGNITVDGSSVFINAGEQFGDDAIDMSASNDTITLNNGKLVAKGCNGIRSDNTGGNNTLTFKATNSIASIEGVVDDGIYVKVDYNAVSTLKLELTGSELRVCGGIGKALNVVSVDSAGNEADGVVDYTNTTGSIMMKQNDFGTYETVTDKSDLFKPRGGSVGIFFGNHYVAEYQVKGTTDASAGDTIDLEAVDKDTAKITAAEITFDGVVYNTFEFNNGTYRAGDVIDISSAIPYAVIKSSHVDIAPEFKDVTPASGKTTVDKVTVAGTVTGDVKSLKMKINDGTDVELAFDKTTGAFSKENVALVQGTNTIVLSAAPVGAGDVVTHTITLEYSTAGPTINIVTPTGGKVTTEQYEISGTTDGSTVKITVNGKDAGPVTIGADHKFSKTVTLDKGENAIVVKAIGTTGETVKTFNVTYDAGSEPSGNNTFNYALLAVFIVAILAVAYVGIITRY